VHYVKIIVLVVVQLGPGAVAEAVLHGQRVEFEDLCNVFDFLFGKLVQVDPQQVLSSVIDLPNVSLNTI